MEYASQEYDELELLGRDGMLELNNRFPPHFELIEQKP